MSKKKSITILGVLLVVFLSILFMANAKKPEDTPGNPHDDLADCEERVAALEAENADLRQQLAKALSDANYYEYKYEEALGELQKYQANLDMCEGCLNKFSYLLEQCGNPQEQCYYPAW